MGIQAGQPAVGVELGIWSLGIGPAGIFQRLLSPSLFNISRLLGVLAAKSCLCCQHRTIISDGISFLSDELNVCLEHQFLKRSCEKMAIFSEWIYKKSE